MAINAEDVKIMRPERVTDESDGGGQMTGTEIISGDVNNLFDDISRVNLAYGNVSMRKLFCAIRSANTDTFLGAHMCIMKDADTDIVSSLLFNTDDHYDERAAAADAVERYVVRATRSNLRPVGTQREGQTAIVVFSKSETDSPEIGDTLSLLNENAGIEQYIKVSDITVTETTYTYIDANSEYQTFAAYQFDIKITQPLNYDFEADEPTPGGVSDTVLYKTQTSSTAKYYGIRPLAQAATAGAMSVYVDTIFQPIVPVATSETSLLDQTPGAYTKLAQASGSDITLNLGSFSAGYTTLTLPVAFVAGSLRLTIGSTVYVDTGSTLKLNSGVSVLGSDAIVSAVDGTVTFTLSSTVSISATFTPAAAIEMVPYTAAVEITTANRQLTYTDILAPLPDPGTFRLEYMYNGSWYEISDTGTGELAGIGGGSGTLNLTTGSFSVTLPAEPDEGSSLIYTWAQSPFTADSGADAPVAYIRISLPDKPVDSTVSIEWMRSTSTYTATETAGVLSGSGTGYVQGSVIYLATSYLPTSDVVVSYTAHDASLQSYSAALSAQTGGSKTIDVGVTDINASSVNFELVCTVDVDNEVNGVVTTTKYEVTLEMYGRSDGLLYTKLVGETIEAGSIDEAAGTITVDGDALQVTVNDYVVTKVATFGVPESGTIVPATKTLRIASQTTDVYYYSDDAGTPATYSPALADLQIDIQGICSNYPVPGSLLFTLGGTQMVDRGNGYIYRSWSAKTAAGTQCGQIGYTSCDVLLDYSLVYSAISNLTVAVQGICSGIGASVAVTSVVFRVAATPLRTSGLQLQARRASDTALITAASDVEGALTGSFDTNNVLSELPQPTGSGGYSLPVAVELDDEGTGSGDVDYENGIVKISFDQPVILSTLTYNAVAYTTVPLDPDILGLDPVKLPSTGKVQVIQPGYLVVIHNSQEIEETAPTAGQVIDCGRQDIAKIKITDASGTELASDQYTADKTAGTVTLADPFSAVDEDGNSLTLPLSIMHRVEDMAVVSSAAIGGKIAITTQLTHDYPAETSFCSSAILFGDLRARVYDTFFQKVDVSGEFEDSLVGDAAVAAYDDLNYAIEVDNLGCVQERWKIKFTGSSAFQLIGEQRGVVGTGSTNTDFSPLNPETNTPYFTIRAAGWGEGWVTSNIVRFNTDACAAPGWLLRTTLQSSSVLTDDSIVVEFRGDSD